MQHGLCYIDRKDFFRDVILKYFIVETNRIGTVLPESYTLVVWSLNFELKIGTITDLNWLTVISKRCPFNCQGTFYN